MLLTDCPFIGLPSLMHQTQNLFCVLIIFRQLPPFGFNHILSPRHLRMALHWSASKSLLVETALTRLSYVSFASPLIRAVESEPPVSLLSSDKSFLSSQDWCHRLSNVPTGSESTSVNNMEMNHSLLASQFSSKAVSLLSVSVGKNVTLSSC